MAARTSLAPSRLSLSKPLYVGAVNHRPQQQPHRVNNNMTFAPVDLFPGVIAALTALLT